MEHLSNRNRIGTFQKLNDRKYHFFEKNEKLYIFEGQGKFCFSNKKSFNHNQAWFLQIIFPKLKFPRIMKTVHIQQNSKIPWNRNS